MPTTSIRVRTPDGDLFVHIAESNGKPIELLMNIGKSGYALAAWSDALGRIASLALRNGIGLREIADELSNIRADRVTRSNGIVVHSGPEGLATAIMRYLALKYEGGTSDYRPATMERDR